MTDRVFVDTNILVYDFVLTDSEKHNKVKEFLVSLINRDVCISTQVLSEAYSALKKKGVSDADAKYYIKYGMEKYNVLTVTVEEIKTCLMLRDKYNYSYWIV